MFPHFSFRLVIDNKRAWLLYFIQTLIVFSHVSLEKYTTMFLFEEGSRKIWLGKRMVVSPY